MAERKTRTSAYFFFFVASGVMILVLVSSRWDNTNYQIRPLTKLIVTANTPTPPKTLLLVYNKFFGLKEWITANENCSVPRAPGKACEACKKDMFEITYDKQRFNESNFVLLHVATADLPNLDHLRTLWKKKPSSQQWIYFIMESPKSPNTPNTRLLSDMFHLTFTYRLDSDFWAPYGSYLELPVLNLPQQDFSAGKDKMACWMVSNCGPQLRNSIVHELQKHISVDVYGGCSGQFGKPKYCSRNENCIGLIKQYKFYLAFENSLCEDYVTEKYWSHLGEENVVPIVLGGANYTKLAIPGSYINALDFKSVKHLADYLHYLDKNNTAYNEYFKWRLNYRSFWVPPFCSLCEVLSSGTPQGIKDLTEFWKNQGQCNEKELKAVNTLTPPSKLPE